MATIPSFELEATDRSDLGKGASRRLRRLQDLVPGIVYGGSKKPQSISLAHRVIKKSLENEAFYSHILTLTINGKKEQVILKALQRHPYKPIIQHMDFQRVDMSKPLHINVPLHFLNEKTAPGVQSGGQISHHMADLAITCLPGHLPEFIEVDLANLALDESIYLSNLALPEGVTSTILSHGTTQEMPVVSIHLPRIAAAEDKAETEESEGSATASKEEASDKKSDKKVEPKKTKDK